GGDPAFAHRRRDDGPHGLSRLEGAGPDARGQYPAGRAAAGHIPAPAALQPEPQGTAVWVAVQPDAGRVRACGPVRSGGDRGPAGGGLVITAWEKARSSASPGTSWE